MKIIEAINRIDSLKHNTYSMNDKIAWLSRLDSNIKRLIIDTHEGWERVSFTGYNDKTDLNTEMLVPEPFDELYLRWLEAQIDYTNGEYDKYNNAITMYQVAYDAYANYYNRTNMPKKQNFKYFGEPATKEYQSANSVTKITIEEV